MENSRDEGDGGHGFTVEMCQRLGIVPHGFGVPGKVKIQDSGV